MPYYNNKSNFLKVSEPDEAWSVATFVSASGTQALLGRIAMSTTISPGKLRATPIPAYGRGDDRHRQLAKLGAGSKLQDDREANVATIDGLVLTLGREVLAAAPRGATG